MASTSTATAADLAQMAPDRFRYELIRGELRRMSPTAYQHGRLLSLIDAPLTVHVAAHDLGDVLAGDAGFVLERNPDTVLAPDIAFVRKERIPPETEQIRFADLPPDLVVEIVSPGDRPRDITEKVEIYLAAGVRLLWLFYPGNQTVRIHRPGRKTIELGVDDTLDGEDVVPGFRLPLADVFRRSRR